MLSQGALTEAICCNGFLLTALTTVAIKSIDKLTKSIAPPPDFGDDVLFTSTTMADAAEDTTADALCATSAPGCATSCAAGAPAIEIVAPLAIEVVGSVEPEEPSSEAEEASIEAELVTSSVPLPIVKLPLVRKVIVGATIRTFINDRELVPEMIRPVSEVIVPLAKEKLSEHSSE